MPNRVLALLVDPETGVIVALNLFPCVEVGLALESDGIGLTAVECLSCIQGVFETEIGDDVGHVLWPVSQMARNFSGLFSVQKFPLYLRNAEVLAHQTKIDR